MQCGYLLYIRIYIYIHICMHMYILHDVLCHSKHIEAEHDIFIDFHDSASNSRSWVCCSFFGCPNSFKASRMVWCFEAILVSKSHYESWKDMVWLVLLPESWVSRKWDFSLQVGNTNLKFHWTNWLVLRYGKAVMEQCMCCFCLGNYCAMLFSVYIHIQGACLESLLTKHFAKVNSLHGDVKN